MAQRYFDLLCENYLQNGPLNPVTINFRLVLKSFPEPRKYKIFVNFKDVFIFLRQFFQIKNYFLRRPGTAATGLPAGASSEPTP